MPSLLEKTRKLNKILQKSGSDPVVFKEICQTLSEVLASNIYLISRKGKILGHTFLNDFECDIMKKYVLEEERFPVEYNERLLRINESILNINNNGECIFEGDGQCELKNKVSIIVPVIGNRERLGTLLIARSKEKFTDDDLVLSEYSATIVGMEILRAKQEEFEIESRKKTIVQVAVGTLSYSELEAVDHIFKEINGDEGLVVASKIADAVGITRSVIVNALRKFESAGVIESRSLGMKGTRIKILNDKLIDEINKLKN